MSIDRTAELLDASHCHHWQEWRDSNPQPPVLETGALTKLSYTPILLISQKMLALAFGRKSPFATGMLPNRLSRHPFCLSQPGELRQRAQLRLPAFRVSHANINRA